MPGWNPYFGHDASGGRQPYGAPIGGGVPGTGQPYIPQPGANFGYGQYQAAYGLAQPGTTQPMGQGPPPPYTWAYQPNGAGSPYARQPATYPGIDVDMPAAQMTNSSGGLGCEPGYNYFFGAKHTKAHVFRSNVPPWQLPANTQMQFKAVHIPTNVTGAELLKGFGCNNASPKKNRCYEITGGAGGKWYSGMVISGDNKDDMKASIADFGWDETRTGAPGGKPVVCLWFCKD